MAATAQELLAELEKNKQNEQQVSLPSAQDLLGQVEEPKKNFFQRFGADLKHRFGEQGGEIIAARVADDQSFASTALQLTGKVGAGTILDLIGELLISGGRGLSAITPDAIENPVKGGVTATAIAIANSQAGKLGIGKAFQGVEEYQEWAKDNPVMARNIESVVDIGLIVAPVKATPKGQGLVGRAGEQVRRSGVRSAVKNKQKFVERLVRPEQTAKNRLAETTRATERGPLKAQKIEPTPLQKESIAEVMKLNVSRNKSTQGNLNIIREAVFKETDTLAKSLTKTGKRGAYSPDEFSRALDDALVRLQENPALVGNAELSANRVIDIMRKMAKQDPPHVSNLLRARKRFDKKLIDEGRDKLFDPNMENAISFAVREVRKTTNDFIQARVPSVGVSNSLFRQSRLLRAADDIKVKAANEANNAITRTGQKLIKVLRLRGEAAQTVALGLGMGGLGAATVAAPFITKIAGATAVAYIGGRLVMAPGARKAIGSMLKMVDKATLRISDPAVLAELRADRALIVELLKMAEKEDE